MIAVLCNLVRKHCRGIALVFIDPDLVLLFTVEIKGESLGFLCRCVNYVVFCVNYAESIENE